MNQILKNPLTDEYYQLKELVLGKEFSWFYEKNQTNEEGYYFYSHVFLERPDRSLYPSACQNILTYFIQLYNKYLNSIIYR